MTREEVRKANAAYRRASERARRTETARDEYRRSRVAVHVARQMHETDI